MQKVLLRFLYKISFTQSARLRIGLLLLSATMLESCGNNPKNTSGNNDSSIIDTTTIIKSCYAPSMEEKIRHTDSTVDENINQPPQTKSNSPVMCYDVIVENDSAYRVE